jgi:hypothetical protein
VLAIEGWVAPSAHRGGHNNTPVGGHEALSVDGLLENVLERLPKGFIIRSCSLVGTRWHAAAVYVTVRQGVSATGSDGLLLWLCRHGTGLKSLTVSGGSLYHDQGYNSMDGLQQLTRLELMNMTERPQLLRAVGNSLKVSWCGSTPNSALEPPY